METDGGQVRYRTLRYGTPEGKGREGRERYLSEGGRAERVFSRPLGASERMMNEGRSGMEERGREADNRIIEYSD